MNAAMIRRRLAALEASVEPSVMDPGLLPWTEWWRDPPPVDQPCEACGGFGLVAITFGESIIGQVDCPRGCTGRPAD